MKRMGPEPVGDDKSLAGKSSAQHFVECVKNTTRLTEWSTSSNARYANRKFAGCVLVSGQESWVGAGRNGSTAVMTEWQTFVRNQVRLARQGFAGPKLVCIDLQPYTTTQAPERSDILNVGGFSDAVFSVVAAFLADDSGRFVAEVEKIEL